MRRVTMSDLCDNLHNYFEQKIHAGTFKVENGSISLPFLIEGQYFRIVGSVMNDGVYKYPCGTLANETFEGEVWAMGVPPAVIALLAEINEWNAKYSDNIQSPYQSESFAGYSYTKATDAQSGGFVTWQTMFRDRLSRWRKI